MPTASMKSTLLLYQMADNEATNQAYLQPPSRRWDRQSFGEVRNLIIQASEFIDARLRVQQMRRSLIQNLEKGRAPPEIDFSMSYALADIESDDLDYSDMFAVQFAVSLKDEYARVIEQARQDLIEEKCRARQAIRETVIEGREEGMALQLYDVFCRAAERKAKPMVKKRRRVLRE